MNPNRRAEKSPIVQSGPARSQIQMLAAVIVLKRSTPSSTQILWNTSCQPNGKLSAMMVTAIIIAGLIVEAMRFPALRSSQCVSGRARLGSSYASQNRNVAKTVA